MQINGPIPFHIARAYGVRPQAPVNGPPSAVGAPSIAPASNVPQIRSLQDLSSVARVGRSQSIDQLVGATVNQPISFDGAATAAPQAGSTLQLYTSAAEKIEAAVAVNVGRALDVSG